MVLDRRSGLSMSRQGRIGDYAVFRTRRLLVPGGPDEQRRGGTQEPCAATRNAALVRVQIQSLGWDGMRDGNKVATRMLPRQSLASRQMGNRRPNSLFCPLSMINSRTDNSRGDDDSSG